MLLAFAIPSEWTPAQWHDYAMEMYQDGVLTGVMGSIIFAVVVFLVLTIGFNIGKRYGK